MSSMLALLRLRTPRLASCALIRSAPRYRIWCVPSPICVACGAEGHERKHCPNPDTHRGAQDCAD
ncbi:hypothetical protein B0H17DRAFT_1098696 [Mycena rosella]|uniref:CCHC-type domain-containing protein n=1 Tax=Mycena rosella TaxID=1033263 RepID=A0AAD7G514_MYCRO|nr:hypothetical protein B0H17DRAFT_1098696 [Mycena rosella]